MKILFIYPTNSKLNSGKTSPSFLEKIMLQVVLCPPLTFQILSAVTPREHTVKLIDERYQHVTVDEEYDLVAISIMTPCAPHAYELADAFRRKGIPIVLGGWHPSVLPNEAKQHADAIVIGEGEESWPMLLKDSERGKLQSFYEKEADFSSIPPPDRRHLHHHGGIFFNEVQSTRGCSMGCRYCSITNSKYCSAFRFRPIDDVIDEINSISQKIIYFSDPSLTLNPRYTKQLFKSMKDSNKKFSCNGNASVLYQDDELLTLAREAGCIEWSIGFESISQESLQLIGKQQNKVNTYGSLVKKIHDQGMAIKGNFMFGMDADSPSIFAKTCDAITDWELDLVSLSTLTPYPGTPLFDDLQRDERIFSYDWSKYDSNHVVFQPKLMSPNELEEGVLWLHDELYSFYKCCNRMMRCFNYSPYSVLSTGVVNLFM